LSVRGQLFLLELRRAPAWWPTCWGFPPGRPCTPPWAAIRPSCSSTPSPGPLPPGNAGPPCWPAERPSTPCAMP
jgi:hypothetical protein